MDHVFDQHLWIVVGWGCGTFLSIMGVLALIWAFMKPWLVKQLVEPVQETHTQVSINSHSQSKPTVLDRIDDVHREVSAIRTAVEAHLVWSADINSQQDRRLSKLEQEQK